MTSAEGEEVPGRESKMPWDRPTLTPLGNVKDLIRASPKGSGDPDADVAGRKDRLTG
jgi:hypothetical protein